MENMIGDATAKGMLVRLVFNTMQKSKTVDAKEYISYLKWCCGQHQSDLLYYAEKYKE